MPLQSASIYNKDLQFPEQNLNSLITTEGDLRYNSDEFITKISRQAFEDSQNARLTWGHTIKKHVMTTLVHGGLLITPIAGVGGGMYYSWDYIKELSKDPSSRIAWGLLAVIAVDGMFNKVVGYRFTTLVSLSVYRVWDKVVGRISEEFLSGYTRIENESQQIIAQSHEKIKSDLASTYGEVAQELASRYINASSDPKLAREIQTDVKDLKLKLPMIAKVLSLLNLSAVEVSDILMPLNQAIEVVYNDHVIFKNENTAEDNAYNAKLMADFSLEEFALHAIPQRAQGYIEEAAKHRLGVIHTVKAHSSAALSGITAFIGVSGLSVLSIFASEQAGWVTRGVIGSAMSLMKEGLNEQTKPIAYGVGVIAVVAFTAMEKTSSDSLRYYENQRRQSDETVAAILSKAVEKLKDLYDGIADYLEQQDQSSEKNLQCQKIREKLEVLDKQVLATCLGDRLLSITERLRKAVKDSVSE